MKTKNNKNSSVTISFNVTPELADALDSVLMPTFDSRASYVRKLLINDLRNYEMLGGFPRTPAEARALGDMLERRDVAYRGLPE